MDAKGWHYQMQIKMADGNMMCKLNGRLDKGHYDVQIKRWMKKVAL